MIPAPGQCFLKKSLMHAFDLRLLPPGKSVIGFLLNREEFAVNSFCGLINSGRGLHSPLPAENKAVTKSESL